MIYRWFVRKQSLAVWAKLSDLKEAWQKPLR